MKSTTPPDALGNLAGLPAEPEHAALRDFLLNWVRQNADCPPEEVSAERSLPAHGVDSLRLAELAGLVEARLGVEVSTERLFSETIEALARALTQASPMEGYDDGAERAEELRELAKLPADFPSAKSIAAEREGTVPPASWQTVLLTGGTGFLGTWLLHTLLRDTDADVVCLVRGQDAASGLGKLRCGLTQAGLWKEAWTSRLRVLSGDLGCARFGWTEERFARVSGQLDAIIHAGARVHWSAPLRELAAVNVGGTVEVLRLAAHGRATVHLVSSVGVYPIGLSPEAPFSEERVPSDGDRLRVGYFKSKWAAERCAEEARHRGVPVVIYRPSLIVASSGPGSVTTPLATPLLDAFFAGCVQMGRAPRVNKVLDVVPVEFVAHAVVAMARAWTPASGHAFNLKNPQPLPQARAYERLRARGYPLREVAYPRWREAVLEANSDNHLAAFRGYYQAVSPAVMRRLEVQMAHSLPVNDGDARAILDRLGIQCPPFDDSLMDRLLDAHQEAGILPPPPEPEPPASAPEQARGETLGCLATPLVTTFASNYTSQNRRVAHLYDRSKQRQWDAALRLDWSRDLDPESPDDLPDQGLPLFGSPLWERLTPKERGRVRHHFQAWQISQYRHGEQGALLAASKLVQQVPDVGAKMYSAAQAADEARHLEAFTRLLDEKMELAYPVNPSLERLLADVLSDSRWDVTCLGMQVLIEGLALAAFATMRTQSCNPLMQDLHAAIMEDEARHLAFGRLLLAEYVPQLSDAERQEREEFVIEASYALRDRFRAEEVWEQLGLPVASCIEWMEERGGLQAYRAELFGRIAPTVKAIGLMGPNVVRAFDSLGVLHYAHRVEATEVLALDRATLEPGRGGPGAPDGPAETASLDETRPDSAVYPVDVP